MEYDGEFFDSVYTEGEGDPWAYWSSDYERRKAERPVAALRDRRDPADVDRILDIGCGNGAKTQVLAEAYPNAEIVGVDLSKAALEEARERTEGVTYEHANAIEYVADVTRPFDAVFAVGALHYLCAEYSVTDLLAFADDLCDSLSPCGLLVAAHNHMPRGSGPPFVQERSVRTLRTVLTSALELVGRSRYEDRKTVALDPDEPAKQPYEVWVLRPRPKSA